MVASHPFPDDGGFKDNRFEVFDLSTSGVLTPTGQQFRMGVANLANALITFTPDGTIGMVPQDDGTLGVFRFDDAGTAVVVHAAFQGGFYAGQVLMGPAGNTAWVIDEDTRGNGGGVYQVAIACDGSLTSLGRVLPGDGPSAIAWLNATPGEALVAGQSLGPNDAGTVHLADLSGTPSVLSTGAGFPDPDAIPPALASTPDDVWVAVPDNGFAAGNRIAILQLDAGVLVPAQLLTASNPMAVAFSPFARVGLVVNSDGSDHFRALNYAAGPAPWSVATSPMTYAYGRPQLPGAPAMLSRGGLNGRLFIAELDAVRQLQFEMDGGITDVSKTPAAGTGSAQILGTLGVQP